MNVIDAAHKTVHNTKHGGAPALALRMGMSKPTVLNSKVNPNCSTHHLRLDEALTIMEFTEDYSIIHAMAQHLGGVYCKVDHSISEVDILMTALSTSACQGEVMTQMHQALDDGHISPKECSDLLATIQSAMSMLQTLSLQLKKQGGSQDVLTR